MKAPMMVPVSCLPGSTETIRPPLTPASGGKPIPHFRLCQARQIPGYRRPRLSIQS